jgi:hypothetical protein
MPAKSAKQEKFMQAVANNPSFAKKVGVPQSVGREFTTKKGTDMKKMNMGGMYAKGGMKKMAGGGLAAGHKSADGVAKKGKTKGKQIAMARGGMKGCK